MVLQSITHLLTVLSSYEIDHISHIYQENMFLNHEPQRQISAADT